MTKFKLFIFLVCLFNSGLYAQPSNTDYLLGYGGIASLASSEFIFKEDLAPIKPKWSEPNGFDLFFRENLKWNNENINRAALFSDVLVRGITVPSIFWSSYKSGYKYSSYVLLHMQVIAATGLLTHMSKYIMGRQRPYSHFKTMEPQFPKDNLSFFSGHSSFSFAVATASGYLLERSNPHYSGLIWSTGLLLASTTGYLRIAADRHYMSDVLTGMLVGTLAGYLITKNQGKEFFKSPDKSDPDFQLNFSILIK